MVEIGIDFGTTTTVGARNVGGTVEILTDAEGTAVHPSVVAFIPNGETWVGTRAYERRPIDPVNTIYSMKRIIGLPWRHLAVREFVEKYPFKLEPGPRGLPRFCTRAGFFDAGELSARLITHVVNSALQQGHSPTAVVVGVPSEFASWRREVTLAALAQAGLGHAVCVDEPLAIMRAFLLRDLGAPRRIAVYDLGGGTFDVAVCEVRNDDCVLLASGGDQFLGGDDIDLAITELVAVEVLRRFRWDIMTGLESRIRLLVAAEKLKIELSTAESAAIDLRSLEDAEIFAGQEVVIEKQQLDRWAYDLARKSFVICDEVMAKAGIDLGGIDEVFLSGGTTRIPAIQKAVGHYFGRQPTVADNPDHLVAIGAAVIASELSRPAITLAPAPGAERRRDPRLKTSLRVRVSFKDLAEFQTLIAHDISAGGTFIAMMNPPKPGQHVVLRIEIDDRVDLEIKARIVRREFSARVDGVSGMGVEFAELSAGQKAGLMSLLSRAETLFGPARPRGELTPVPAGVLEK